MVFENIEQLQRQWTDKFVVVDAARPELTRFSGMTGVVKTVNFSGRALVEFDANNNIGWFDIDPKFLKMIDAPPAKPAGKSDKKAAPAIVEKPAVAKPATAKSVAAKPAAAGSSVADILAAARAGKGATPTPTAKAAEPATEAKKPVSTADILAAARGKSAAPPPKSTADILAAARGKAAPAASPPPVEPEPEVVQAEAEPEAVVAQSSPTGGGPTRVDRSKMDVAAMIAYCRRVDSKG